MKKFYPVIHCIDPYEQGGIGHALANARIAYDNGADGVFLIGHKLQYPDLIQIYDSVRKQFPERWIGINFLDIPPEKLNVLNSYRNLLTSLNAFWFDSLPIGRFFLNTIEIFGGVAFKYRNADIHGEDLRRDCEQAVKWSTTVTTSGNKTGEPPTVEKLEEIRIHLKGKTTFLALASGVNTENVTIFLPLVDSFLVASSIVARNPDLGGQEYLVPEKVRRLADLIHTEIP